MITASDEYYAALERAHGIVARSERDFYESVTARHIDLIQLDLAKALLGVEERRQLALGELGEAIMKDGPASHWHAQRTSDILAGRIEV